MPYNLQKTREQGNPTRSSQVSPAHGKGTGRVGLFEIAALSAGSRRNAAGSSSSRVPNDGQPISGSAIRFSEGGNNGDMRPPPFYPHALPQPDSRSARAMKSTSAARFVPPRSSTPERAPPSGLNAGSPIFVDSSIESIPMVLDEPDVPPRSSSPFKVPGSSRNAWQRTGSSNNVLGSSSSVNVDPNSKVNSLAVGNGKGKRKEEYALGTARMSTTGGRHLESMLNGCAREPTMLSSSPPPADTDARRQQCPSSTSTYVLKAAELASRSRRRSGRRSRGNNETMDSSLDVGPEDLSMEADEDFPMWGMGAIGAGTKRNRRG
ncbi:unnamed protein product [Tilletia controversa]|nr:unnamed protein product [Tilletia controversa]